MLSRLLTTKEQLVLAGLGVSVLVGAGVVVFFQPERHPAAVAAPPVSQAAAAAPANMERPTRVLPPVDAAPPAAPPPAAASSPPVLPPSPASAPLADAPSWEPAPKSAPKLGVSVQGAVNNPDFYWMPADARVQELLDAANGLKPEADLSDINLSARLVDGTTLTVPLREVRSNADGVMRVRGRQTVVNPAVYTLSGVGSPTPEPASPPAPVDKPGAVSAAPASETPPAASSGLVNVNTASQAELESLPGIGPALAGRIIAERPFATVKDLDRVSGIGEKKLAAIETLVTTGS